MIDDTRQSVTVTFNKELVAWIDKEADKHYRSRSAEMENLLADLMAQAVITATPKKNNGSSK